ncbi:DBF zinc finger domain-containing protein [Phthorimaea operculella]|nr:DBF zinc finger domain-containing protein [Phthorimaea operculella]
MVSTLNLEEKYNKVRRNFCFYLDIQDNGLARSLSRRLQDLGLVRFHLHILLPPKRSLFPGDLSERGGLAHGFYQQEVFLTSRVTHVVRDGVAGAADVRAGGRKPPARCNARTRTHAMVERARPSPADTPPQHHVINVSKAITLLDKLYDTFFAAPRRPLVKHFSKHYIKIEFLDKICRPVFKEFDDWPEIPLDPDPPKEKKDRKESTTTANQPTNDINQNQQTIGQKMTRKSRPRIKEKDDKEPKGGYCEMCNADYADAALHRRSPHHLAFVRDHTNFLALDSLIGQ